MPQRNAFFTWLSRQFRSSRGLILPRETSLMYVADMVPRNFRVGLEILNDDRTKMDFVVAVLMKHVGQTRPEAIRTMLAIHKRGGILVPVASLEEAQSMAEAVAQDAAKLNFPLVCRAVSLSA